MLTPSEIEELRRKSKETMDYAFKAFSEPMEAAQRQRDTAPAVTPAQMLALSLSPKPNSLSIELAELALRLSRF